MKKSPCLTTARRPFVRGGLTVALICWLAAVGLPAAEPVTPAPAARLQVTQWDRFEVTVTNPKTYADPYRDVRLEVVFSTPYGKEIAFWGFYDGGQTWRIRFMPPLYGLWRYRSVFSDGTAGPSGEFRVDGGKIPGMLTVNQANPIWFAGDVRPVLIRGLHIGDRFFAANWPAEKRAGFLDWAQGQGYNLLSIASHYLNRDSKGRGRGWETPRLWPLDAGEFQKMETVLNELARRGFYVYPFAGFFGQKSQYPQDPADQELFVRYTLARIGCYWNILLNVASPEPNLDAGWMPAADVARLGRLIRDLDVQHHPLSVHNATGDDPYRDSDWTTYGTLQGPKTLDRAELSAGLLKNHHPAKPLLAQETLWSGNKYHPDYTDDDLRKNAYVLQFSAAALVFGDFAGDSSSGFSGTMEPAELRQSRHDAVKAVWDFFATVPYYEMKPRQDLVSQGYCLAWPGRDYLVYLEKGGTVDVTVEGGPYTVTWINARQTTEQRAAGTTDTGRSLQAPDAGDWVLRLTRTGGGLPDQIHLSWQGDPATTLTVTWHTIGQDNPALVEYRRAGDTAWASISGETFRSPGDGWLHRATLGGLTPDTGYEYRVSSDRGTTHATSHAFVTRTAPQAGKPFTLAFVADTGLVGRIDGNATGTSRIMEEVTRDAPLFIIGGGDYAYANRDLRFTTVGGAIDEWFNQWQPLFARIPLMAQYGNHEDHLLERYSDWSARLAHPPGSEEGRNYSFDVAGVHFAALYLAQEKTIPDERLDWLDRDLAAARQRGARWIVVYHHVPLYAHGRSHAISPALRARMVPILEKHGVDISLTTHDQNYERTFPLSGVGETLTIRSRSLDRYRQGEGLLYVKVSPAGKKSEAGNDFSRYAVPQQDFMAVRETGAHHYALLHFAANGELKVEVFSLPDREGRKTLLDSFVIEPRSAAAATPPSGSTQ